MLDSKGGRNREHLPATSLFAPLTGLQLRNPVEVEIMNNAQLMLLIETASTNQVTFSVEATETPFFPPRDAIEVQSGNIYPKGGEKKPVRKEITNPMSGDRVSIKNSFALLAASTAASVKHQ